MGTNMASFDEYVKLLDKMRKLYYFSKFNPILKYTMLKKAQKINNELKVIEQEWAEKFGPDIA
jgi:hypothetical protein